ncbi:MAG: Ni/Fe hydrogenase subunit alpha [Candidatus Eisenbacteria bacterium]
MKNQKTRTIKVDALARVEGEGGLTVKVRNGAVTDVELRIYEPPRFFEALLRGRQYAEAPDFTSRICGICPVAYQMSAVHAIERAFGIEIPAGLRELRRLLYCGECIESHVLHVTMLHAPDFLGYESGLHMAKDHPAEVTRGLQLKKVGNQLVTAIGGREIHPVSVKVGGFYRVPTRQELRPVEERLKWAREAALETVRWVSRFEFPNFDRDYEFVALRHPGEYPFNEGRLVSGSGLDVDAAEYERHFVEEHVPRSNALHSSMKDGGSYMVGPLARYSLNFDRLSPVAQEAAREAGLGPVCRDPFRSIIVRAVETLYAVDEALRIIANYEPPDEPAVPVVPRAGTGCAITEAPRGILYHYYRLDDDGLILDVKIVPPTSQNQKAIEEDLGSFVQKHLDLEDQALTWRCEQAIRNYDPCISCATHFLRLTVERG